MLSYIVGFVAIAILLANPISQLFSPSSSSSSSPSVQQQQQHNSHIRPAPQPTKLSPRPQLNEALLALDGPDDAEPGCPADAYVARILRREPLVVYLENFLSEEERKHLLEISDPLFEPSTFTNDAHSTQQNTSIRDSSVALIPRTDPVRCIERRALRMQGSRRDVFLERLRTQRYVAPHGHYSHHFDWSANRGGWGRVSSFMVWVDDGQMVPSGSGSDDRDGDGDVLEGGGTEFPLLEKKGEWCDVVECGEDDAVTAAAAGGGGSGAGEDGRRGSTFKVKPGNAVYWENFAADGRGYEETWHAGLPVLKGSKVGLNIWSFGRIEG